MQQGRSEIEQLDRLGIDSGFQYTWLVEDQGDPQTGLKAETAVIEEIQVSWLTDGGDLERTFSFITDPARSVLTQWQPFPDAPEDGSLVRLTFVIRDGRGGTDWVERGLCVLPPPAVESPP